MEATNQPTPVILDDEALAEIEARANAATRAPWRQSALAGMYIVADKTDFATIASVGEYNADGSIHLAFADAEANLSFITHARTDIPALCATVRALRAEIAEWESHRDGIIEAVKTAEAQVEELEEANTALREQLAAAQVELRRWRNGDQLPEGWTCLDAGDGFPNLYLYSRADIVEQAKARLAQVEKERDEAVRISHAVNLQ